MKAISSTFKTYRSQGVVERVERLEERAYAILILWTWSSSGNRGSSPARIPPNVITVEADESQILWDRKNLQDYHANSAILYIWACCYAVTMA